MPDPDLDHPPLSLLAKLGSLAVHVEELLDPDAHEFDRAAIQALITDPEVKAFLQRLDAMALLPVKRS